MIIEIILIMMWIIAAIVVISYDEKIDKKIYLLAIAVIITFLLQIGSLKMENQEQKQEIENLNNEIETYKNIEKTANGFIKYGSSKIDMQELKAIYKYCEEKGWI